MKFRPRAKPAAVQIEREASLWVIRCERELTAAEQDEFLHWLAADRRHGREFACQRNNWARLALLADWRPEHSATPNRDLLAPPSRSTINWARPGRFWIVPTSLAAAAAVALGVFFTRTESIDSPVPIPPTLIAAIEQRTLPDGSIVTLNRGAEVSILFTSGERRLRLERGEAHFKVARLPDRPFVVSVRGVDVRALGTTFNVRLNSAAIELLVTEGRVHVKPPRTVAALSQPTVSSPAVEVPTINAGQRAVVSLIAAVSESEIADVTPEEIEELLAWQPKFLDFVDAPLSAVVAEFNRRNAPVRIAISDPSLAETEVSASLRSDNIEGFIRLLQIGFGVEPQRSGNTLSLRKANPEHGRVR